MNIHTAERLANTLVAAVVVLALTLVAWALGAAMIGHASIPISISAVTLAQSALLSRDELQRGVLETFVMESVVLDRIPLMEIQGNSYMYDEEGTLPNIEFRAVNSSYTEGTGTVNQKSEKLVILGGDADVDTFIQKTRGNLNDQRAIQDQLKVKAASYKFQDTFINGDSAVDANSFDGLKKRLVGGQVLAAGTNGIPVVGNGGSDVHAFLDFLDQLIALVPGMTANNGAIFLNNMIRQKIIAALRRINVVTTQVGRLPEPLWQSAGSTGMLGQINQASLPTYNGIPLIDIGNKADGTMIIPQTETQGTAVDASSIYVVRFGSSEADQAVTGLTNGGVDVRDLGEQQVKPAFRTRIEFFCGLGVFGGRAAARGTGVRNL